MLYDFETPVTGDLTIVPLYTELERAVTGSLTTIVDELPKEASIVLSDGEDSYTGSANQDGTFRVEGVPAGDYELTVTAEGPVGPVGPMSPCGPMGPRGPVGPVAPRQQSGRADMGCAEHLHGEQPHILQRSKIISIPPKILCNAQSSAL